MRLRDLQDAVELECRDQSSIGEAVGGVIVLLSPGAVFVGLGEPALAMMSGSGVVLIGASLVARCHSDRQLDLPEPLPSRERMPLETRAARAVRETEHAWRLRGSRARFGTPCAENPACARTIAARVRALLLHVLQRDQEPSRRGSRERFPARLGVAPAIAGPFRAGSDHSRSSPAIAGRFRAGSNHLRGRRAHLRPPQAHGREQTEDSPFLLSFGECRARGRPETMAHHPRWLSPPASPSLPH